MNHFVRCLIIGLIFVSQVFCDICFRLSPTLAGEVKLAVASNFLKPLRVLAEIFEHDTNTVVRISAGSTGKLYAQIKQGAPFDVFLAANAREPARLENEGDTVVGSRFAYALGRLVLWTRDPKQDPRQLLIDGHYKHIALANPKLAPYGQASLKVLERLGVSEIAHQGLITCENVAQAHQFAVAGNVELAFLAYSQNIFTKDLYRGSSWLIPNDYYPKILQEAVLLKSGANNQVAINFLKFLKSEPIKRRIVAFGYNVE
ncbi:MAG: molybdate ABC transporter substrate-binding protein [Hyphomicrobiaceae bacterium]|nr:molybdate ABC transporter substrate-binding protein [Hyphomicrobiaceae bacterium]